MMLEHEGVKSRKMIRLQAMDAVDAEMRITAVDERPVKTNSRKVLLLELSPASLRFQTSLWLPPHAGWTIAIGFTLENIPLETAGRIAQAVAEHQWWIYDVELHEDPIARLLLTRVLNQKLRTRAPLLSRLHETYRKHFW